jgi:hypothetical protein
MRYLNTTTLRQEIESNPNNIIDSDARVSNWFTPCPDGHFGEWVGDTYTFTVIPPPTQAELDAVAAYDAQAYARARKAKYDLLNQDEMRYDDVKNTTTTWVDAIDTIKAAHPKP